MKVYNLLKEGIKEECPEKMWTVLKILSESVDVYIPEEYADSLINCLFYQIYGGHFNKEFADKMVEKFYYVCPETKEKCYAPYWTDTDITSIYEENKEKVSPYNLYDFIVAFNMMKSDNYLKLKKWFPEATEEELRDKILEETINYLSDEDNPYGTEKIWRYLNS